MALLAVGGIVLSGCGSETTDAGAGDTDPTSTVTTTPVDTDDVATSASSSSSTSATTTSTTSAPTTTVTTTTPTTVAPATTTPTTAAGPTDADCRADALVAQLVAARDIYEPYEILEVRCETDVEGYGDVMAVRISSNDPCQRGEMREVVAGYVWRDGGWQLEDVENSQAKWGCVGESIG